MLMFGYQTSSVLPFDIISSCLFDPVELDQPFSSFYCQNRVVLEGWPGGGYLTVFFDPTSQGRASSLWWLYSLDRVQASNSPPSQDSPWPVRPLPLLPRVFVSSLCPCR